MTEKNENFPNGFQAFLLVLALMLAEFLVYALLHDVHDILSIDARDLDGIGMLLANGCIFTVVMHFKSLSYRELFHSSASSVKATLLLLLPAIALMLPILVLAISALLDGLVAVFPLSAWEQAMFERMGSGSFSAVVMACVLAPVLEEMLFRGIILRSFLRQYSKWNAIIGSATLFGFAHLNLYQFAVALIIGSFAGWLYERTRSLLPCIALHAAYNTTLTVIALSSAGDADASLGAAFSVAWLVALVLGAAGIHLLRRLLLRAAP